ncbi:MAG: putative zinc-binding protein [Candidatus Thermoplasmatota archaeon]|nr:putative zinc-binding protein [Candidatus Thermoplasmatota archaeon]
MAKGKCLCEADEVLIFPFLGGSNVGQLANEAAKQLTNQGVGGMYCLAGIGGHISGFAEATWEVKKVVVIDGCPVHCARKILVITRSLVLNSSLHCVQLLQQYSYLK